jgi:YidC/Oxa1 family membrane protein insertase
MLNDNNRNTIVFIVCALLILLGYQTFVIAPKQREAEAHAKLVAAQQTATAKANPAAAAPGAPGVAGAATFVARTQALARSPRVAIDSPDLSGSIALKGARIDDLFLKDYRQTIDPKSPMVELFRPDGAEFAYFAELGWTGANVPGLPGPDTVWTTPAGQVLKPGSPVLLTYDNGQGLTFTRKVEVDDRYMFTLTDTVANHGPEAVTLAPYGSVQRQGIPPDLGKNHIIHEGAIGVFPADGKEALKQFNYGKWKKQGLMDNTATGGWLGITDKYWLAAMIPGSGEKLHAQFRMTPAGAINVYDVNFVGAPQTVAPGGQATSTTRLFAGAKTVPVLRDYEAKLHIPRFDDAVDWGNFSFFTRPIFNVLEFFYRFIGNFGLAIMALTVAVKLLFFPLANKSYESLTKMKKIQPQLEALKKKNAKDPQKQQQDMMALYAKEKINPFMGCLPVIIQIPVFYSLYKVLSVTIEMRHAPFYGWIHDLSSRDPNSIWTLFGLLHWDPSSAPLVGAILGGQLHIGLWPIIMGFTMWLQQAMSPPQGVDPMQQKIFQFFPIILTFTLSNVAAGLVIYWSWNNLLSILQQYVIMRRFKVDNPIDDAISRLTGKPKPSQTTG